MLTLQRYSSDISFKNHDNELQSIPENRNLTSNTTNNNNNNHEQQKSVLKINNKKKTSSHDNHANDELDKHFQEYLKFRKHDDYIEYKVNYIEAKTNIKNSLCDRAVSIIIDNSSNLKMKSNQTNNNNSNKLLPGGIKLLQSNTTPFVSKKSSLRVMKSTNSSNFELSSLDRNYYNWKILKNQLFLNNGFINNKRFNGLSTDAGKQIGVLKSTLINDFSDSYFRDSTENSYSQIKLIDKNKKKTINSLKKLSKIKAIKDHALTIPETISHSLSFIDFGNNNNNNNNNINNNNLVALDGNIDLNMAMDIHSKDIPISSIKDKEGFLPKIDNKFNINNIDAPFTAIEQQQLNLDINNKIDDDLSSFKLASNIPVYEQDEFKNSLDDIRGLNDDDDQHDDRKHAIKLQFSIERTKDWIESHEYFFLHNHNYNEN